MIFCFIKCCIGYTFCIHFGVYRAMQLIELEPHFWELYQNDNQYFMSVAVDMSSVVSCWDLALRPQEITAYKTVGRASIDALAKSFIAMAYKGDFSNLESRLASIADQEGMQASYRAWQLSQSAS